MERIENFWLFLEKGGKNEKNQKFLKDLRKGWIFLKIFGKSGKRWNFLIFFIDFLKKHDILLKDYEILGRGVKNWKIHKNL